MKKLEVGIPGAFRESANRFNELRRKKPTQSDVVAIIEESKTRHRRPSPKKSARSRDLEA
jgi:hypothetical protein